MISSNLLSSSQANLPTAEDSSYFCAIGYALFVLETPYTIPSSVIGRNYWIGKGIDVRMCWKPPCESAHWSLNDLGVVGSRLLKVGKELLGWHCKLWEHNLCVDSRWDVSSFMLLACSVTHNLPHLHFPHWPHLLSQNPQSWSGRNGAEVWAITCIFIVKDLNVVLCRPVFSVCKLLGV